MALHPVQEGLEPGPSQPMAAARRENDSLIMRYLARLQAHRTGGESGRAARSAVLPAAPPYSPASPSARAASSPTTAVPPVSAMPQAVSVISIGQAHPLSVDMLVNS